MAKAQPNSENLWKSFQSNHRAFSVFTAPIALAEADSLARGVPAAGPCQNTIPLSSPAPRGNSTDHIFRRNASLPGRKSVKSFATCKYLDFQMFSNDFDSSEKSFAPVIPTKSLASTAYPGVRRRLKAASLAGKIGHKKEDPAASGLEISLKKIYLNERLQGPARVKQKKLESKPAIDIDFSDTEMSHFEASYDSQIQVKWVKSNSSLTQNLEHMVKEQAHKRIPVRKLRQKSVAKLWNSKVFARNLEARKAALKLCEWKAGDRKNLVVMNVSTVNKM